jgi:hypothetical protein
MFERPEHRLVLEVLQGLRSDVLADCRFLFAGGTRIVLELQEYRVSKDVDFICSDAEGYAQLRLAARQSSYGALFSPEGLARLQFPREIRVDQYGIRFPVVCGEDHLRVELIREARIEVDSGERLPWSPVDCLSIADCYAEKLLANSDRWADRQVLSRDLIDLAALREQRGPIPQAAWRKAKTAYKSAPEADLIKALNAFVEDGAYRRRCFEGLSVVAVPRILSGLALLRQDLSLPRVSL